MLIIAYGNWLYLLGWAQSFLLQKRGFLSSSVNQPTEKCQHHDAYTGPYAYARACPSTEGR